MFVPLFQFEDKTDEVIVDPYDLDPFADVFVEAFDEVADSLVIGQEWKGDQRMILFLKLAKSVSINDDLTKKLKQSIKSHCSPRHVPEIILPVDDIPYTLSGKKVEIAVKKIIDGEDVINRDALANPDSLDLFSSIPELA